MSHLTIALLWLSYITVSVFPQAEIPPSEIKIGFLPAITQRPNRRVVPRYFLGAFLLAIKKVNEEAEGNQLLLKPIIHDNKGSTEVSLKTIIDLYFQNVTAFIGPEDTCATEALVANSLNLPMIAYKCGDARATSIKQSFTFARTLPDATKVVKSITTILHAFGWHKFSLIVGKTTPWIEIADALNKLPSSNFTINQQYYFDEPYVANDQMAIPVTETYRNTRIYVFLGDDHALVDFVRFLHHKANSRGEYMVITVQEGSYDPKDPQKFLKIYLETREDLKPAMIDAFRAVLVLCPRKEPITPEYMQFKVNAIQAAVREKSFKAPPAPPIVALRDIPLPLYASYLYDAVMIYVRALREAVQEGYNVTDGKAIVSRIRNRKYESILGYEMFIDDKGDAEGNYTLVALQDDPKSPFGKSLQPVGFFTRQQNNTLEYKSEKEIKWIGGRKPVDEPKCGYNGERCRFKPNWTAAAVCLVIAAMVVIATIFGCRHYLYEQKLASLLWKIDYRDLLVTDPDADPSMTGKNKRKTAPSSLSFLGLDEVMSRTEGRSNRHPNITVASYKGLLVAVKKLQRKQVELTRCVKKELQLLKELQHDNINHFIGASLDPPNLCIVTQYCSRGSLQDILDNEDLHLDDMFIASLVFDLIKGMIFLHDSEIGCHGDLRPNKCLVDSRWVLQVAGFGQRHLKTPEGFVENNTEKHWQDMLWRAPELLRQELPLGQGTQKGDIYSFGLILYQIHSRSGPWGSTTLSTKEIIDRVKFPSQPDSAFRPNTSLLKCHDCVIKCMQECWQEEVDLRPDFKYTRVRLKPMQRGLKSNIFDNMLAMMEKYATNLEAIVDERTDQLLEEKKKTETLLHRMLPKSVAEQLKRGCPVIPEHYDAVSIYFSDIVGFTAISAESSPMQVVDMLNDLYTCFDSIIGEYDVYKVETIGDAYMVVSGLPIRNGNNHAGEVASMSLHLLRAIQNFQIKHRPNETLKLRIGIHLGPCVAGVVGLKMPRYCLFGDTVNTASRLESTGLPLKIHCSQECQEVLESLGGYNLEPRGYVSMKGKGDRFTYFLEGEDQDARLRRISRSDQVDRAQDPFPVTLAPSSSSNSVCGDMMCCDKCDDRYIISNGRPAGITERTSMLELSV